MDGRTRIADVVTRCASAIDRRGWELFRTCFTTGCSLDYRPIGHWNGIDAVTTFMRRSHFGPSLHRHTNTVININCDKAQARTCVEAVGTGPGG